MQVSEAKVIDGGAAVEVSLGAERHRFHALWLRDNARDDKTRSPGNGQRLIDNLIKPDLVAPGNALVSAAATSNLGQWNLLAARNPGLRELQQPLLAAGKAVHLIGGADVAAELDAKRAINQGSRLAAAL